MRVPAMAAENASAILPCVALHFGRLTLPSHNSTHEHAPSPVALGGVARPCLTAASGDGLEADVNSRGQRHGPAEDE
jgi:hypothetical protein